MSSLRHANGKVYVLRHPAPPDRKPAGRLGSASRPAKSDQDDVLTPEVHGLSSLTLQEVVALVPRNRISSEAGGATILAMNRPAGIHVEDPAPYDRCVLPWNILLCSCPRPRPPLASTSWSRYLIGRWPASDCAN